MKKATLISVLGLLNIGLVLSAKSYNQDVGLKAMYYSGAAYCERNSV